MYPTCGGMNRGGRTNSCPSIYVPHMRGDEPEIGDKLNKLADMYPTCVGMNRNNQIITQGTGDVPHMRGDEPRDSLPIW